MAPPLAQSSPPGKEGMKESLCPREGKGETEGGDERETLSGWALSGRAVSCQ